MAECLRLAGVTRDEVDCVAVVRPVARGPEAQMHFALRDQFPHAEVVVVEHHMAHAASAFFASPFEEATVLTLDHAGDFRCGARWKAHGDQIELEKEWYYPGFARLALQRRNRTAGLPRRAPTNIKCSGSRPPATTASRTRFAQIVSAAARLDASFFDGHRLAAGGFSPKFFELWASKMARRFLPCSRPPSPAACRRRSRKRCWRLAGEGENLCLAGGLFFNALLVEFLERSGRWKNVFVQAAAGNAGTALGACITSGIS